MRDKGKGEGILQHPAVRGDQWLETDTNYRAVKLLCQQEERIDMVQFHEEKVELGVIRLDQIVVLPLGVYLSVEIDYHVEYINPVTHSALFSGFCEGKTCNKLKFQFLNFDFFNTF